MKFRAAVLHAVGAPLEICTVTLKNLNPDDVLVRIGASGLCHTDLEVMQGSLRRPLPIVLGHEGAGVVERVGSGVTRLKPGDHVVLSWGPHCGHCFHCLRDAPILCEALNTHQPAGNLLDGESRYELDGVRLNHFSVVSSHAEYCVVPEAGAIVVPRELPFDRACLIGCGVMTGVGAVSRLARVESGASVAVVGIGAVGLNVLQGARIEQAGRVIAIDTDPDKEDVARAFGATDFIDARQDGALERVRELTDGRGADYAFECAGGETPLRFALDATRVGGQLVILGKTDVNQEIRLRFGALMGERRLIRSSYGGARPARDFPWLANLYLQGRLMLDELVSTRLPLEQINDGFDAMRRGEIVRAVVTPLA